MNQQELKAKAQDLRLQGKTYKQIVDLLDCHIPKSTLSSWCNFLLTLDENKQRLKEFSLINLRKARQMSVIARKKRQEEYLKNIDERNLPLKNLLRDKDTAKIALAILYLAEGAKTRKGTMMLGNSDPLIISLFLYLLRFSYPVDESKFRCTLQCRADQEIKELEKFWANITKIPLRQFYKARIDPRSVNKPSLKKDYKGVCRIDYMSANTFYEIMSVAKILCLGL